MSTTHFTYVPLVKGKENDLGALGDVSLPQRGRIKPVVEPRPVELGGSVMAHLQKLASDLSKYYPDGDMFVDFLNLTGLQSPGGRSAVATGLDLLDRRYTPVWGLQRDDRVWDDLKARVNNGGGVCIRIDADDMDDASEDTWSEIIERTGYLGLSASSTDILIDLRDVREKIPVSQKNMVLDFLSHKPAASNYRAIIVAGSSALRSVHPLIPRDGVGEIARNELMVWLMLQADVGDALSLTFGDYGVVHPDFTELSGGSNANGKIRYSSGGRIAYFRGHQLYKPSRFSQYRDLAAQVMRSGFYSGKDFSQGDRRVFDCANNLCGTGNLGTWVRADMNHHMQYTVGQLDRLIEAAQGIESDVAATEAITELA